MCHTGQHRDGAPHSSRVSLCKSIQALHHISLHIQRWKGAHTAAGLRVDTQHAAKERRAEQHLLPAASKSLSALLGLHQGDTEW